ncbi:MAG: glycosyl hydrolase [Holophagales bacterium]|nr:glycosyl hydrolase [Holophagales bacterium]
MRAPVASRLLCLALVAAPLAAAPAAEKPDPAEVFAALPLREIGPALASGRVADLAVDAERPWRWLVGVASGGVWSTENAGASWTPLFDREGSFSIGAVAVDPNDPLVYWVGTGENNGQRSVAYGDGVYKSIDGGRSWKNVGLGDSQHVGKILVDPRDSDVVWVAAQGPLWNGGGDRGLYKTTDGGATWTKSLAISDDTGVSDVVFHPQDPDTLYATAWQRRRHVWTVVSGGPEGAVYKSTDGGASWRKVAKGLPEVDLGRIGLAVTPAAPDWVYAVVEAANGEGGFYRSTDRGESWEKRSGYVPGGPQYYNELVADPKNPLRVYSMDVWIHVTDDGGKSFRELGEWNKHSDNHALWIDPAATDHLVVGCDGGLYETFDGGKKWRWIENLPTVQFYKVAVDDREPFYHVYGGTQDNFTLGGPARTPWQHGIRNSDWRVIVDGDGFQAQAEPGNPDVVYAQAQYANLVRMDLASGDQTFIQPQAEPGEAPLRWNWDSPLVVSPHSPTRLYYAAQHVFRSDDRGDRWRPVSPDLTRQVDRDALPVMGRIQVADAVAKSGSTSPYGNVVALAESRRVEGLLYAGTDDGLVQVSEDGGGSWRRIERFPGVPERAYVRDLVPSAHDADVVYAALEDHKSGDFRPFVLKSSDRGRTWRSIAANLPEKGSVYALAEDPVDARLLFAGTEFGLWASQDGGAKWFRLKGGLPTIQVRDLAIQEREGDLVVATFGRGFWVLDDLSPLRTARAADLEGEAMLFPVRDALAYVEQLPLGYPDKSFQGDGFYTAANPPYGALLTIYLRDEIRSKKDARHAAEAEALEAKREAPYPKPEALVVEAEEEAPTLVVTISDASGAVVRRLRVEPKAGLQRVAWDLRWPAATPARLAEPPRKNAYDFPARGPLAAPGRYTATLAKRVDGVTTPLGEPRTFEVVPAGAGALPAADRAVLGRFVAETAALQRAALGASSLAGETAGRLVLLARALDDAGAGAEPVRARVAAAVGHLREIRKSLEGDSELARRSIAQAPALLDRINHAVAAHYSSIAAPTGTARRQVELASTELGAVIDALRRLVESDLPALEAEADRLGAPWTPGRVPVWPPAASPNS